MLVQERAADRTVGLEPSGQFKASLRSNRRRESNHRLCWWFRACCGGCRNASWIKSDSVRLANRRDQLPHTASGSLLIGCGFTDRLSSRGCTPNLGQIRLKHRPANWVAIGGKNMPNGCNESEANVPHLDRRGVSPSQ